MKKVKILHCADLHFDTPFCQLSYIEAEKRKEDLRETFGKIINIVKKENIPILLISGDLFDNQRIMKTTLEYIIQKLEEIQHTKVFISPGNHDPYGEKSFYSMIEWSENVHIFRSKIEKITIPLLNVCVYGIGFSKPYERESLIEKFTVEDKNHINIMVLHGQVVSQGQGSDYNPITLMDIEKSGLDYLALGHCHGYSGVNRAGNTFWAYSGNPEGRGFDELGQKGIILGEVGKESCHLDFQFICKRQYLEKSLDISGTTTYEEIKIRILEEIEDIDRKNHLYKIILKGEIPKDFTLNISVLREKLKDAFHFVKILDHTKVQIDYEAIKNSYSLKGIFIRNMRKKIEKAQNEEEKKGLELALKMGIRALEDGEVAFE